MSRKRSRSDESPRDMATRMAAGYHTVQHAFAARYAFEPHVGYHACCTFGSTRRVEEIATRSSNNHHSSQRQRQQPLLWALRPRAADPSSPDRELDIITVALHNMPALLCPQFVRYHTTPNIYLDHRTHPIYVKQEDWSIECDVYAYVQGVKQEEKQKKEEVIVEEDAAVNNEEAATAGQSEEVSTASATASADSTTTTNTIGTHATTAATRSGEGPSPPDDNTTLVDDIFQRFNRAMLRQRLEREIFVQQSTGVLIFEVMSASDNPLLKLAKLEIMLAFQVARQLAATTASPSTSADSSSSSCSCSNTGNGSSSTSIASSTSHPSSTSDGKRPLYPAHLSVAGCGIIAHPSVIPSLQAFLDGTPATTSATAGASCYPVLFKHCHAHGAVVLPIVSPQRGSTAGVNRGEDEEDHHSHDTAGTTRPLTRRIRTEMAEMRRNLQTVSDMMGAMPWMDASILRNIAEHMFELGNILEE